MTKPLRFSALLFALTVGPLMGTPAEVKSFVGGEKTKFSTLDHAKSKGLNMTISYPNGWKAKEGERPNIVQKFVSKAGTGTDVVTITTTSLPSAPSAEEVKDLYTDDILKEMIATGAKFIKGTQTKLDGEPAGMAEYSLSTERAGIKIETQCLMFVFISKSTLVKVDCMVGGTPGGKPSAAERAKEMAPLFTLIASSIVLPDKWK